MKLPDKIPVSNKINVKPEVTIDESEFVLMPVFQQGTKLFKGYILMPKKWYKPKKKTKLEKILDHE